MAGGTPDPRRWGAGERSTAPISGRIGLFYDGVAPL